MVFDMVTPIQELEDKGEWFFGVFTVFLSDRFLNVFSSPFLVHSRSPYLFSQRKFFELWVRTLAKRTHSENDFVTLIQRDKVK